MIFTAKDTRERLPLTSPACFSARVLHGKAELVTPTGNVYGREGDVLSVLAGAQANNDDARLFRVIGGQWPVQVRTGQIRRSLTLSSTTDSRG